MKEALKNKLNKEEFKLLPTSFDIIGDIVIFNDFPDKLKRKEKLIAETLMKLNKNIKTVAKKTKKHSGKFRLAKIKIIGGKKTKETLHKENGILLKLDVEQCYFSPRTANERLRIAKLVKNNESVLVFFSGVAPFPCVIAKNSKAKDIYGIEWNEKAHEYGLENVKMNKLKNVKLFNGDVKKLVPKIIGKFDRILLPLPKDAEKYLDLALKKIKKNGTIHLYSFASEKDFNEIIKKYKNKFKKVKLVKCGQYAPGIFRICLDLKC